MNQPQSRSSLGPLSLVLLLSGGFFILFLLVSGVFVALKSTGKHSGSFSNGSLFGSGSVGVIELKGEIHDSKKILRRLEKFEDSENIKAVVLRINSGGGQVAPSQEIYEAVKHYRKPLVVSMGSMAASGAYYIACGAKKIYANPGTMTGSIGVIMEFANLQKLYDWAKIQRYAVKSGKFKDSGAEYREMSAEERELMQNMVNDILQQFKEAVAQGRKLSIEKVSEVADGRVLTGRQAKALHLVDELGTLQDAVQDAAKQAHIEGKPRVVYAEKANTGLLDLLLDEDELVR